MVGDLAQGIDDGDARRIGIDRQGVGMFVIQPPIEREYGRLQPFANNELRTAEALRLHPAAIEQPVRDIAHGQLSETLEKSGLLRVPVFVLFQTRLRRQVTKVFLAIRMAFLGAIRHYMHMNRKSANPFALWTDLAFQTGEMLMASAQVVQHRTTRMAQASIPPSAKDSAEFTLMATEKAEAVAESALAIAGGLAMMGPMLALQGTSRMASLSADMAAAALTANPLLTAAKAAKLATHIARQPHLGAEAAKLALAGMRPVHRRAIANARRLGRT